MGFRKATNRKKALNIIQFFADIYIGYECIFPLSTSRERFAMSILLVVAAKIILHIFRRDSIGNFIGILLNTLFIIMSLALDLELASLGLAAYIVHILRIKSCYVDKKLKDVYGYPNFNFLLMKNELSKDTLMADSVKADYDELLSRPIIKFSVAESCCSVRIQLVKVIGAIVVCVGLVFMHFGIRETSLYNNSVNVESLDNFAVGMNISGNVHELYNNCVVGTSKNTTDGYWGVFGNKLVLFDVPDGYKPSFAELYNTYAEEYELKERIVETESVYVSREEGVDFHAKIMSAEDYDSKITAPKLSIDGIDVPEADTTLYIRVIDNITASSNINKGLIISLLGLLSFVAAYIAIYRKMDNYFNLNDQIIS